MPIEAALEEALRLIRLLIGRNVCEARPVDSLMLDFVVRHSPMLLLDKLERVLDYLARVVCRLVLISCVRTFCPLMDDDVLPLLA